LKTASNVVIKNNLMNDTCDLVDISTVMVDQSLPKLEKTIEYIKQIKNPYQYKCGKFIVTACFHGNQFSK
jgi:hypothetical protein